MTENEIIAAVRDYNADDMDWIQQGHTLTLAERIPNMRPVVQVRVPDHQGSRGKRVFVAMPGLADEEGFFLPATDEQSVRMDARTNEQVANKATWWGRKSFDWAGEILIKN